MAVGRTQISHGGTYKGSSGSSHKGGHYANQKGKPQYGKHTP